MQYPPSQPNQPSPPPGQYNQYPPLMQGQPYSYYPQQPPPGYQRPPQGPYIPQQPPPKKKRRTGLWVALAVSLVVVIAFCAIVNASTDSASKTNTTTTATASSSSAATATAQPTEAPTPTAQAVHYPPTTGDDLHGLAAKGDASAIHEFHSESVGAVGACPQPKREVTVDPGVTGQRLAEDLLAYFYGQQLDSPCGSLVLAYHNQREANDVYTAGRINFDATDSSGATNFDPNASNLKYTLTLDVGGLGTGQEYVVTY